MGLSGYRWVVIEEKNRAPEELLRRYGKILGQLIYNRREIFNNDFDEDAIFPTLTKLLDPKLFNELDVISYEIANAVKKKRKIVVYGDYDADGITATALLVNFLRDINADVRYYIPSRFEEGYGLNKDAIRKIAKYADILIVVDSGTNAVEELIYAKNLGLKVVVLDHHEPKEELPIDENIRILNPKLHPDINHLFKHLASVGIAFYVMIMLRRLLNIEIKLKPYLDIVSIGTVADVVPLSLINRIFVQKGIEEINKKRRVGIKALLASLALQNVTSFDIGYTIAPRLNAAGRLDDARKAVKLLTSKKEEESIFLSKELDFLNKKRQKLTEKAFRESQIKIRKEKELHTIVVGDANWHPGIVGIVAGRLAEKYKVPAFVLSIKNGKAIGSVRSTGNINIFKLMEKNADLFDRFGGHPLAAGLTMPSAKISLLKERLSQDIKELSQRETEAILEVDMEVPLKYWTIENVEKLKILEPFGEGNPYPQFLARNLRIDDFFMIGGANQHLKFWLKDEEGNIHSGLWWNASDHFKKISVGMYVDIVYTPKVSSWKGKTSIDFVIKDMELH
jgi:single-stranded-DNA-specific exonuclease